MVYVGLHVLSSCLFFIIKVFKTLGVLYLLRAGQICGTSLRCVWWCNPFFMDIYLAVSHETQFSKYSFTKFDFLAEHLKLS